MRVPLFLTVIAPPIQCYTAISSRTFLNNYDITIRNMKEKERHWVIASRIPERVENDEI